MALFQDTLKGLALPAAEVMSYHDLLAGADLPTLTSDTIIRLESPGKDFEVERALLRLGAECDDPESGYERLSKAAVEKLSFEKGRILPSRQWYLGYCALLDRLKPQLLESRLMNRPEDIQIMFDKRACHALLQQNKIAVPDSLPLIDSYDTLMEHMRQRSWQSVFIKLAHSSSASGVVAYRTNNGRHQATTTVEMAESGGMLHLYNSRRMQTYHDVQKIAALIDKLCQNRVQVERWIPKAGIVGKTFDLRIVVIAGKARHTVVRMSHNPITNLHLLNERGDLQATLAQIGATHWEDAQATCERAASTFASLYSGIDLLFTPNYQHHAILEMNAFGDLLPGIFNENQDTYTAEIMAMKERYER